MVKSGISLLVIAAAAALVSTEAALDKAHTIPNNPVVKKVTRSHGKISLTLDDGTVIHTKEHVHALDKAHTIPSNPVVKKVTRSHGKISLTLADGTVLHTKEHVKVHGKESEGVVDGEVIHKYANGVVKIASNKQSKHKKIAPPYKQVEAENEEDKDQGEHDSDNDQGENKEDETSTDQGENKEDETSTDQGENKEDETSEQDENIVVDATGGSLNGVNPLSVDEVHVEDGAATEAPEHNHDSADVDLEAGESVSLTFGDHNVTLTLLQNGTLELEADDTVQYLPAADDVTVQFDDSTDFEESDEGAKQTKKAAVVNHKAIKKEVGFVEGIENKVTEFVTQLKGESEYFTKKSTPFLIGCGLVGALAIVVGIAAVAVGRARDNAAASADPQSVLAENEEDEDLEAATSSVDAAADDSESLSDAEAEEGKFANEVVVSV